MSGGNGWRVSSHTTNGSCVEAYSMEWRTSSKSNGTGCVEVAFAKSSYSSNGGDCVEVGVARTSSHTSNGNCVEVEGLPEGLGAAPDGSPYVVAVRNSKRPEAGTVVFTAREWDAFLAGVHDGEFALA